MKIAPFSEIAQPLVVQDTADFVFLYKPAFFHSVSLRSADEPSLAAWYRKNYPEYVNAFQQACLNYSEKNRIPDALKTRLFSEFGMLSRLDYQTSGLVAFAKNPEGILRFLHMASGSALKNGAENGFSLLRKEYLLVCTPGGNGVQGSKPLLIPGVSLTALSEIRISGYFRSWGERGRRVACIAPEFLPSVPAGKKLSRELYQTQLKMLINGWQGTSSGSAPSGAAHAGAKPANSILAKAVIIRGFRHQIRAHCAWTGHPILGDAEYGGQPAQRLFLESFALTIPSEDGKPQRIELYPECELK